MKICAVSYLNTKPFLYGLENNMPETEVVLQIPSQCVEYFAKNQCDIALIPVGSLPDFDEILILNDFCIGANGKVDSVFLFSHVPVEQIQGILLDYHSRTSNLLAQILCKYYWKISPEYQISNSKTELASKVKGNQAAVVIGDRAIAMKKNYPYVYDLSYFWKLWTGLPFVFAVWVVRLGAITENQLQELSESFRYGIEHLEEVANQWAEAFQIEKKQVLHYYQKNIDYQLDAEKKKAIELFLNHVCALESQNIPTIRYTMPSEFGTFQ